VNLIAQTFGVSRVLLPVIHPVSRVIALDSIRLCVRVGIRGIFLINQGMREDELLALLREVQGRFPALWVGVNLLGLSAAAALSTLYGKIDGIWTDTAEVDERRKEQPAAAAFVKDRHERGWGGLYFGGVAFKYQREVAYDQLCSAAAAASPYVDVLCTSGPGTGKPVDVHKLIELRHGLANKEKPLALASGVTTKNVHAYLPYVQAFLVGTGIEKSLGVIDGAEVAALQRIVEGS